MKEAESNDPAKLKAEVAKLKAELAKAASTSANMPTLKTELQTARLAGFREAMDACSSDVSNMRQRAADVLSQSIAAMQDAINMARQAKKDIDKMAVSPKLPNRQASPAPAAV